MSKVFKVAIIGLDTSHSVALPQLMQDPNTPAEQKLLRQGIQAIFQRKQLEP